MKNLFSLSLCFLLPAILHSQIPTTGNVLWLKAGQGVYNDNSTTLASIGHTVHVWTDHSGQGNHFTQDDPAQRPELQLIPGVLCSQPAIYFDPARRTFLSSPMLLSGPKSIFIVFLMPPMNNAANDLLSLKGTNNEFTEIVTTDFAGYRPVTFIADLPSTAAGSSYYNSTGINTAFSANGNILSFFYNGGGISSSSSYAASIDDNPSTVFPNGLLGRYQDDISTIGARAPFQNINFLKGYIAEIIVYDRVLNNEETDDVEHYLVTKYGFQGTCTVLPLSLFEFKAVKNNTEVKLGWKIEEEAVVKEYDVQHSRNGTHWATIEKIKARIEATGLQHYQSIHHYPVAGTNYYRLVIRKTNETLVSSSVRKIIYDETTVHNPGIFPNPFTDIIHLDFEKQELLKATVINSEGKICRRQFINSTDAIDLSFLPPGIYLLQLTDKQRTTTFKIFKK